MICLMIFFYEELPKSSPNGLTIVTINNQKDFHATSFDRRMKAKQAIKIKEN